LSELVKKKVMVEVDETLWKKFKSASDIAGSKLYDAAEEAFSDYIKKKIKEGVNLAPER
jgi:TolA-binding protein